MASREKFVLTFSLVLSLCTAYYFFGLLLPVSHAGMEARNLAGGYGYGNDFYQIWATTKELLAQHADPYGPEMQRQIEIGLYGRTLDRNDRRDASVPYRGYSYPLQANLLTQPLGYLSFHGVQWTLSFLLPVCVVASVVFWCSAYGQKLAPWPMLALCVVVFATFPVLEGIYALQPTLVVAAIVAGSMLLLRRNRMGWAGVLLAMGAIKPHLIALLALWFLLWTTGDWSRRKAFLIAFISSSAALLLFTQFWYPEWWLGWWRSLPAYRQINTPPLAQFVFGRIAGGVFGVVCLAIGAVGACRWRRAEADSSEFLLLSAYILGTSVVVGSSSVAVYDQFLLLPGLLWLWSERYRLLRAERLVRVIAVLMLATFFWPWAASVVLAILSFSLTWARSYRAVLLPLATAATFPIAALALLAIFVWRTLPTPAAARTVSRQRAEETT